MSHYRADAAIELSTLLPDKEIEAALIKAASSKDYPVDLQKECAITLAENHLNLKRSDSKIPSTLTKEASKAFLLKLKELKKREEENKIK